MAFKEQNSQFKIPLLVFAKAPIPGKVKTRLESHCSQIQAAEIASILLDQTLANVCSVWPGDVFISTWLDFDHPFLRKLAKKYGVEILPQREGDLGQKMNAAFSEFGYPMVILGSDAPHVSERSLLDAHRQLSSKRSVIGPSEDGGYYLIGLAEAADQLFVGQSWGTASVLNKTLEASISSGLELLQLEPLQDVDTWDDLLVVQEKIPALRDYLILEKLL